MTKTRRRWMLLSELAMICASACALEPASPAADSSSTSPGTTGEQSEDPSPSTGGSGSSTTQSSASSDEPTPDASSSDESSSGDTTASGPPAPACDPVVPGEYNGCLGPQNTVACNWTADPEATGWISCITAALVEDGSVCTITDCVDRCDCFAPPSTGTATVECMDGIIESGTACVLFCGGGEVCPDGMECSYNICVAPPG